MLEALRIVLYGISGMVGIGLLFSPRRAVLGLVLLIPFITRFLPRGNHGLNAETLLFIVAILGLLLHSRPSLPPLRILGPIVAWYTVAVLAFLALLASGDLSGSGLILPVAESVKARLWPSLLLFVGFALVTEDNRRRVLYCLVIGLAINSVGGLIEYFFPTLALDATLAGAAGYRPKSELAGNPNHLGALLGAFLILPFSMLFRRETPFLGKLLCIGTYAIGVPVLLLTQSRGAWLAFLVAHAVWLFFTNRKLLAPAAPAFSLLATIGYSADLLPDVVMKRVEKTFTPGKEVFRGGGLSGRIDSSLDVRLARYRTGLDLFAESPLWGHGTQGFPRLAPKAGQAYGLGLQPMPSSESILVSVAVESGLIGLAVLCWLSWVLILIGRSHLYSGDESRFLGILFLSIFAAVAVASMTQTALYRHEVALPFWLMVGLVSRSWYDLRMRDWEPQTSG